MLLQKHILVPNLCLVLGFNHFSPVFPCSPQMARAPRGNLFSLFLAQVGLLPTFKGKVVNYDLEFAK